VAVLVAAVDLSGYLNGTFMIVRMARPHPGEQPRLFDAIEGMRHQVLSPTHPTPLLGRSARAALPRPTPASKTASRTGNDRSPTPNRIR
jgi:hypothetical protein